MILILTNLHINLFYYSLVSQLHITVTCTINQSKVLSYKQNLLYAREQNATKIRIHHRGVSIASWTMSQDIFLQIRS